jgi:hypothetical protein
MEYRSERHIGDILKEKERNIEIIGADLATRHGFTQVPNFILTKKDISVGAKLAYAMLLKYAWGDDACFPGQAKLAEDMGAAERSVRTYLKPFFDSSEDELFYFQRLTHRNIIVSTTPTWGGGRSGSGSDNLCLAYGRRQGKADCLEYTANISGHWRAHDEVFAVLLDLNLLQPIEVRYQSAPLRLDAGRGEAISQGFANNEGQERTKHMASDGGVGLVIDRPCVED